MKKTIEILVGIPCSGKSTYSHNLYSAGMNGVYYISRDEIREAFKKPYIQTKENEDIVTEKFNKLLHLHLLTPDCTHLILDNTHCKEGYIDKIVQEYKSDYNIKVTFFEISLFKAHYRNIVRYFKTGKWIPLYVINNMYKNFNKINRRKYKKYL